MPVNFLFIYKFFQSDFESVNFLTVLVVIQSFLQLTNPSFGDFNISLQRANTVLSPPREGISQDVQFSIKVGNPFCRLPVLNNIIKVLFEDPFMLESEGFLFFVRPVGSIRVTIERNTDRTTCKNLS